MSITETTLIAAVNAYNATIENVARETHTEVQYASVAAMRSAIIAAFAHRRLLAEMSNECA